MGDPFDSNYEFNAPKFVDFLSGDQNEDADTWFDNRPGDEGGIDLDMVPLYEKAMGSLGYKKATSSISRALSGTDPNGSPKQQPEQEQIGKTSKADASSNSSEEEREVTNMFKGIKIKQERKSAYPESTTEEPSEPIMDPGIKIKQERKSVYPEATDTSQDEYEEDKASENETEDQAPNLNETYELEKESDTKTEEEHIQEDANTAESIAKAKPVRKSNIRKSWSSPQPLFKASSRSEVPAVEIKKERKSTYSSVFVESEAEGSDPEQKETIGQKRGTPSHMRTRSSNVRTSWNSPAQPRDQSSASKATPDKRRSQPLRKVRENSVDYGGSNLKRKTSLNSYDRPGSMQKKTKVEVKPIVMPETPSFVRRMKEKASKKGETTEAMQLKKIRDLQRETRLRMRQSKKSKQQAMKATNYMPIRSVNPVTKPKEFNFATDTRIKEISLNPSNQSTKTFEGQLRAHPPSPTAKRPELTRPKPFNLSKGHKEGEPAKKWESAATMAHKFNSKTPDRFHTKSKLSENEPQPDKKQFVPKITNPKTPQLSTKSRGRPVTAQSKSTMEDMEVEEMKSYQFKATELNPLIFEKQGMYGVHQMKQQPTTKTRPFHFESDARRKRKNSGSEDEAAKENAKVHPKINASKATTNPKANTSRTEHNNSKQNVSKVEAPKATTIQPFSFESRDKERYAKKEQKIQDIIKEEAKLAEFRAQRLPVFSPEVLPHISPKKPTMPQPFHLTENTAYTEKWQQQLQMEAEKEKEQRQFKAQPAEVLQKPAYRPKTGLIPPTDITDLALNTDLRAKEREQFEAWKNEQEKEKQEARMLLQKQKEEEEERLAREQREKAVVKANPIRKFKTVDILPSTKPLTAPETPHFATDKRFSRI